MTSEPRILRDSRSVGGLAQSLEAALRAEGYDLVRVRVAGGRVRRIQIMAERSDGTMAVEDCESLIRTLGVLPREITSLRETDHLEVSSPGLERPLVRRRDLLAALGHHVKVRLAYEIDGSRRFRGVLSDVAESTITIQPIVTRAVRRAAAHNGEVSEAALNPDPLQFELSMIESLERYLTDDEFRELMRSNAEEDSATEADGSEVDGDVSMDHAASQVPSS